MHKMTGLKTRLTLLIALGMVALLIAFVFLSLRFGGVGQNVLNEAVVGGESALAAVGRSYESLTFFVQDNQTQAEELLKAARTSIDNANARLASAGRTDDVYTLRMVDNYGTVSSASETMAEGVDNLLSANDNIQSALSYYNQGEYSKAGQKATLGLSLLTPLLTDFERWNSSLGQLNYNYVASGHRDRLTHATGLYRSEHETYFQYVLLLKSLLEGEDYLATRGLIDEKMKQLQSALANGENETAQTLLQEISELLKSLKDPRYENVTAMAAQLNPESLEGSAFDVALDLKTRLKDQNGIQGFENYLNSLGKFIEASGYLQSGDKQAAEEAANEGKGILGQGQPLGDLELQRLYTGLGEAFNSLLMRIKGQPDLG